MQQSVLDDLSVQKRSEGWKRILEQRPEVCVLRNGTEVLGIVQVCDFRCKITRFCSFAEIPVLYLKPTAIGHGFGSMLLNFAQETTIVREA
jgi:GNAT superfamily N-acetyltransferase